MCVMLCDCDGWIVGFVYDLFVDLYVCGFCFVVGYLCLCIVWEKLQWYVLFCVKQCGKWCELFEWCCDGCQFECIVVVELQCVVWVVWFDCIVDEMCELCGQVVVCIWLCIVIDDLFGCCQLVQCVVQFEWCIYCVGCQYCVVGVEQCLFGVGLFWYDGE